jgi:type II secretory pathway pseudopilin PulG
MTPSYRRHCDQRRPARAGITIIELLVVIGIIGVLAGLLLPALAGARQSGQQLKSLSNLRVISHVFAQYSMVSNHAHPLAQEYRMYPHGCQGGMLPKN